jgi:hypothetical protein
VSHPHPAVLPAEEVEVWQPHPHEEFQEVGKVSRIAIGLLGASTVTHLLATWSDWNTYNVVRRYLGGMPNVDDADLNRADTISRITSIPNVVISVAAVVVLVIWLWRARVKKPFLTKVWWCSWVGALALDVVIRWFLMWMDPTIGSLRGIALAGTASLILTAASAIGVTLAMRQARSRTTGRATWS